MLIINPEGGGVLCCVPATFLSNLRDIIPLKTVFRTVNSDAENKVHNANRNIELCVK